MDRTALVEQMRSTASRIQKISDNMKNCCTKIETTMKGLNGAWTATLKDNIWKILNN